MPEKFRLIALMKFIILGSLLIQRAAFCEPLYSSIDGQGQQPLEALDQSLQQLIPSTLDADDSCALLSASIGCIVSCEGNLYWCVGGCGFTADFCGYDWRDDDEFESCIHFWCKDLVRTKGISTSLDP